MYFKMIVVPFLAVMLAVASAGLIGGPIDADMNDDGAQNALQFAMVQYNKQSNDVFVRQVSEVVNVQKQVSITTLNVCLRNVCCRNDTKSHPVRNIGRCHGGTS